MMPEPASRLIVWTALISACATAVALDDLPATDDRPTPARVHHVRFTGGLDNMQALRDVQSAIGEAEADDAGLIILELNGRSWRADVVANIGAAMRDSDTPIAAWVRGSPREPVGAGHLITGLLADECFFDARSTVESCVSDDLRRLAPEDMDWAGIDRRIEGDLWVALRDRSIDPLLAPELIHPTEPVWLLFVSPTGDDGRSVEISTAEPEEAESTSAVQIVSPQPDGARVHIDAAALKRLFGHERQASSAARVATSMNVRSIRTVRSSIRSDLGKVRSDIAEELRRIDQAIGHIELMLNDARSAPTAGQRRALRERAARLSLEAAGHLDEVEARFNLYPELLHDPPPGVTSIGHTNATRRGAWRRALQQPRENLESLRDELTP